MKPQVGGKMSTTPIFNKYCDKWK